jgi:hypothetical protein
VVWSIRDVYSSRVHGRIYEVVTVYVESLTSIVYSSRVMEGHVSTR